MENVCWAAWHKVKPMLNFQSRTPRSAMTQNSLPRERGKNLSTHSCCPLLKILDDNGVNPPCPIPYSGWILVTHWTKILCFLYLHVKHKMLATGGIMRHDEAQGKGIGVTCWTSLLQKLVRVCWELVIKVTAEWRTSKWLLHMTFLMWSSSWHLTEFLLFYCNCFSPIFSSFKHSASYS